MISFIKRMTIHLMSNYRKLNEQEILRLKEQSCTADDWTNIEVAIGFKTDNVHHTRFSGKVRLGVFEHEFTLAGGMKKHAGLYHATLHNVIVGNNCCIINYSSLLFFYNLYYRLIIFYNVDSIFEVCNRDVAAVYSFYQSAT